MASENLNLMDGMWTEPLTKNIIAEKTITLGEGFHVVKEHFGWDRYDVPHIKFIENTNCRWLPSIQYHPEVIYGIGDEARLLARTEDSWYLTDLNCWVYIMEPAFDPM